MDNAAKMVNEESMRKCEDDEEISGIEEKFFEHEESWMWRFKIHQQKKCKKIRSSMAML